MADLAYLDLVFGIVAGREDENELDLPLGLISDFGLLLCWLS